MDDHGDITDTLSPKSEQLDNVELASGPRTFTVERVEVKKGAEQPVRVYLVDFPRPWKPGTNQRRVLGYCWGPKSVEWVGRRLKLFRDPDVTYGPGKTGGTRIAAMSHLAGPVDVPILLSQGRSGTYRVEPLVEDAPPALTAEQMNVPTPEQIAACTSTDELAAMWKVASPQTRLLIMARRDELRAELEPPDDGPLIPQGTLT